MQRNKYESSLADKGKTDVNKAPGGMQHQDALRHHGLAMEVTIKREGNGRTRITAKHQDGFKHEQVHPETYRAHDMARELLGIEPPPAVQTLGRSRAQPTGPKEDERVRKEDNREDDDATE